MLKFEFDLEKKETFLSFWNLKTTEEFETLVQDSDRCFLRFAHLNPRGFEAIWELLKIQLAEEEVVWVDDHLRFKKPSQDQRQEKIKAHQTNLDENSLDLLDSLNIIDWFKDHTSLFEKRNKCDFTSTFKSFLESIPLPNGVPVGVPVDIPEVVPEKISEKVSSDQQIDLDEKATHDSEPKAPFLESSFDRKVLPRINLKLEVSQREKELLEDLFLSYFWVPSKILGKIQYEKEILSLKKKNLIHFFIYLSSNSFRPMIQVGSNWIEYEEKLPEEITFVQEKITDSIFYLDLKIYERFSEKSMKNFYPFDSESKKNFLNPIAENLVDQNRIKDYLQKNFYEKVLFLLKEYPRCEPPQAESVKDHLDDYAFYLLLSQINFFPSLKMETLSFLINQKRIQQLKEGLDFSFIQQKIKTLIDYGLVQSKNGLLHFEIDTLNFLQSSKTPSFPALSIDSDMSLLGYKNEIDPSMIYYLSIFTDLEISDYLVRAKFTPEKSSLAWFLGYDSKSILVLIQNNLKDLPNEADEVQKKNFFDELGHFLSFFFENNNEFREEKTIKLTTSSQSYFNKLKYIIQEFDLKDQIEIIEEQKIFIFHHSQTYDFFKNQLADQEIKFISSLD